MTQIVELPDPPIDELPVSARTRRTLDRAGITTMGGLEQAMLGDDAIPGMGPKSLDDIDHALDKMEAENARCVAVGQLLAEHNRLANLLMLALDLAFLVEDGGTEKLNRPLIRGKTASQLRESLRNTHAALQVLAPELPDVWPEPAGGDA